MPSDESGGDVEAPQHAKAPWAKGLAVVAALVATLAVAGGAAHGAGLFSPGADGAGAAAPPAAAGWPRPRSLLESDEMVGLITEQVSGLEGAPQKELLRGGVREALVEFSALVDEHLDAGGRAALREARLGPEDWAAFGGALRAVKDSRVQHLGAEALQVLKNNSGSAAGARKALKERFQARQGELQRLREDVVPRRLSQRLQAWAREKGSDEVEKVWGGMLSPRALQEMSRRDLPQSSVQTQTRQVSIASHVRELTKVEQQLRRRLAAAVGADTWANPKINTVELTFSIIAVVLVCVLEVLIHVNLFVKEFSMPTWAWILILAPTEGTAVATCLFGLTIWCDVIFGAVGLNILDLFLLMFV